MAEYLAPGVYVEEHDSAAVPIEGVSTSTAGFVGVTERGPHMPKLVTSWTEFTRAFGGHTGTETSYLPYAVQGFFSNGGKRAYVARVLAPNATEAEVSLGGGLSLKAAGAGAWGNSLRVLVRRAATEDAATVQPLVTISVTLFSEADLEILAGDDEAAKRKVAPLASEMFEGLSLDPASGSFAGTTLNSASNLVKLEPNDEDDEPLAIPGAQLRGQFLAVELGLEGGADGDDPTKASYLGSEEPLPDGTRFSTGLRGISELDDVSLLVLPDAVRPGLALNPDLVEQCELQRYRFAVLSDAKGQTDTAQLGTQGLDSSYAAIYSPWIRVYDERSSRYELVPPVGHVTGVFARTDTDRGVHKAPANEVLRGLMVQDRGTMRPLERTYTKGDQDILNPKGVNVLRDFRSAGRGLRVWGARTTSSNGLWKYVNVRRLFIFVEASLDRGTQWVVFEPNSSQTWTRVVASISSFLTRVWKSGALMGATEQEAFYVRCDRTTMTQDDIDNGRLICQVGIAPVKPAEFVVLRITQKIATQDT